MKEKAKFQKEGVKTSDNSGNGECKTDLAGDCTTNNDCKEEGKYCKIEGKLENECSIPTKGTCTALDNGTSTTYKEKTFFYSSSYMSWWAARNWCLKHGKNLVSLSDLSCTTSGCEDWDGLIKGVESHYYWTNNSKDSCYAFIVGANRRRVYGNNHTFNGHVLCR